MAQGCGVSSSSDVASRLMLLVGLQMIQLTQSLFLVFYCQYLNYSISIVKTSLPVQQRDTCFDFSFAVVLTFFAGIFGSSSRAATSATLLVHFFAVQWSVNISFSCWEPGIIFFVECETGWVCGFSAGKAFLFFSRGWLIMVWWCSVIWLFDIAFALLPLVACWHGDGLCCVKMVMRIPRFYPWKFWFYNIPCTQ